MFKGTLLWIAAWAASGIAIASPNLLAFPSSADGACFGQVTPAVTATAGASVINNPVFLDYDTNVSAITSDLSNASASTIHAIAGGASVNHAPYAVGQDCFEWQGLQAPLEAGTIGVMSGNMYGAAVAAGAVIVAPGPNAGSNSAQQQLNSSIMTVTSLNSGDANHGTGGFGVEFFLSTSYLGLTTTTDSADVGNLSGIAVAVAFAHGSYNAFDVHAALRQTASNWSTGWVSATGFGNVNYSSAAGTIATVFLQGPNLQVANHGWYATLTMYPFRTTRRSKEVIYSCTNGYSWPVKNEYVLADVTAGCGTLLYTSNGTDQTPVFTFSPAASGTVTFVAFTTDGSGAYSRVETFMPQPTTLSVGTACSR